MRTKACFLSIVVAALLAWSGTCLALEYNEFKLMYQEGQYEELAGLCAENASEIEAHPDKDLFLRYCGMARLKLFEAKRSMTDLTGSIRDLEQSVYMHYSKSGSFNLGKARAEALDSVPEEQEKRDMEWKAIHEMWDAIVKQHADEDFRTDEVSDTIIAWSLDYRDVLVDRIIKNEENPARIYWLTAMTRMLADRYRVINPSLGENETRQENLKTMKAWMEELENKTYFDNNVVVGMYTYFGDRKEEEYDQTDQTEEKFRKAVYFYNQALRRAKSVKAKATLNYSLSYLCSRYRSENKDNMLEFYKAGFHHARNGLLFTQKLETVRPEAQEHTFRFAPDTIELVGDLQKSYGRNLAGFIYLLWERKDYQGVVALKKYAFEAGFDWDRKFEVLMFIADAANNLAKQWINNRVYYAKYKEMCLASASRAFRSVIKKYKGQRPAADEEFCTVFDAYVNYLKAFGEITEAKHIDTMYSGICEGAVFETATTSSTEEGTAP